MASGPDHYLEAERLAEEARALESAYHAAEGSERRERLAGQSARATARGQVHATLAAVYAHNRATTELTGLLSVLVDHLREAREAAGEPV